MTEEERKTVKACYIAKYRKIKRNGAKKLLAWMAQNGFFEAPASTRHHGAYAGGLAQHSINVHEWLLNLAEMTGTPIEEETAAVCALLHDLCKIDTYEYTGGAGRTQYTHTGGLPIGHGEKSVVLIMQRMPLTEEEITAINWHMGAFDYRFAGGSHDMNRAFGKCKLAVLLHLADMMATYFDEGED